MKLKESPGSFLEKLLKDKGITKAELARKLGLSQQSYINKIIDGIHNPTPKRVLEISKKLNCTDEEATKFLNISLQARMPEEIKEYQALLRTSPIIYGNISKPSDILTLSTLTPTKAKKLLKLDECQIFEISSDFFDPCFKRQQQILTLPAIVPCELRKGDLIFIKFKSKEGNDEEAIRKFKKANDSNKHTITIKHGSEYLFGVVKSYNDKSQIIISGHKDSESEMIIDHKDTIKILRVVGVLFDRLPKIDLVKFRSKE